MIFFAVTRIPVDNIFWLPIVFNFLGTQKTHDVYRSLQTVSAVVTKMALGKTFEPFHFNYSAMADSSFVKGSSA